MAERIILPLLSSQRHVKLPPEPTNPPGPRDITNALWLTNDLVNARRRHEVTDGDVCNGALYQHKLITVTAAQEGDVHAGFVQDLQKALDPIDKKIDKLMNDMQKLTNDIQTVKNDVNGLKDDMRSMKNTQEHIRRISAILYNCSQGSGDDTVLEVVPFENGDDPTKPPYNLPPLTTVKAVTELNPAQRYAYHKGSHGNQNPHTPSAQRVPGIYMAIGTNRY